MSESVAIIRYRTSTPAPRAKIILQQNLFTFLLEGSKTVHFAGAQVSVAPHQFVLLAAGNCLMSEKIAASEYHSILIFFDTKLLSDFCTRHASLLDQSARQSTPHPFLLLEKDAFLINFTQSLDTILKGDQPLYPDFQQVKLEELFLYLAMHYPRQLLQIRNMSAEADDDLLIREAVTSHMNSTITIEELAFLCNMSLSTFKRKFARIYGNSPNRWFLEKKMERAATLLRQHKLKASEIYFELGYENLSSFIQSFKQVYGITPKQYQLTHH